MQVLHGSLFPLYGHVQGAHFALTREHPGHGGKPDHDKAGKKDQNGLLVNGKPLILHPASEHMWVSHGQFFGCI